MIIYSLRKDSGEEFKTSDSQNVNTAILDDGYRLVNAYEVAIMEKPITITREEYLREYESRKRESERTNDESGSIPSGGGDESNERDTVRN